jgi:hypothetical protein
MIDSLECIAIRDIRHKYFINTEKSFDISIQPEKDGKFKFYSYDPDIEKIKTYTDRTVLINDIPVLEAKAEIRTAPSIYYVTLEYYINSILPLIDIEPLY